MGHGKRISHVLGILALITAAGIVRAVVPLTAPPLPARVALADLIAMGKVTSIEDEVVPAAPLVKIPGVTKKVPFRIAVVSIHSSVLGADKLERVRVAFTPPPSGGSTVRGGGRLAIVRLAVGDEGCFFLRKHPDEPFYVASAAYDFLAKDKTKEFDKEIAQVKRCVRLLGDAKSGLESKEADDRLLTAALLLYRYRTPRHVYLGKPRTEPIPADESKRILTILSEADWDAKEPSVAGTPMSLFLRLDLTSADGWEPPAELPRVVPDARKWLREHSGEYRIQRYLPPDDAGK
jgi:hypothetical protein